MSNKSLYDRMTEMNDFAITESQLLIGARDNATEVRRNVMRNPTATEAVLNIGVRDTYWEVRKDAIENPNITESLLKIGMLDEHLAVRNAVTRQVTTELPFAKPPRKIANDEGQAMFNLMLAEIKKFKPDEIIGVHTDGVGYALWISQQLKLPLGIYWPSRKQLDFSPSSKRIVFVDDNMLSGGTFLETRAFMVEHHPNIEFKWAVFFADAIKTPPEIQNQVIKGAVLDFFAIEPVWGLMRVENNYGKRTRDV